MANITPCHNKQQKHTGTQVTEQQLWRQLADLLWIYHMSHRWAGEIFEPKLSKPGCCWKLSVTQTKKRKCTNNIHDPQKAFLKHV